jgi:hypothetical protein
MQSRIRVPVCSDNNGLLYRRACAHGQTSDALCGLLAVLLWWLWLCGRLYRSAI